MAKDNKKQSEELPAPAAPTPVVQNARPKRNWASFDNFWASCVKNGTPLLKDSFKAHLKSMGWLHRPEKWVEGAKHFGIPMEK
jgi:hypothetical protein